MDINELATGGGKAIDFEKVGFIVEGTLTSVGDWREMEGKFGVKVKAPFNLIVDNEDRTVWVPKGSRLATVLGEAMKEAGLDRVVPGGTLKIQRVADVDTGKGNPMHDYRAKYTPARVSVGAPDLDEF